MKNINEMKVSVENSNVSTNKFLDAMFVNTSKGVTENGAVTFIRSGSLLLDFYAQAGAMRNNPDKALELFTKAYAEDKEKAIRVLFYLRDVRGGQGERDLFRKCLQWLGDNDIKVFEKIIGYVSEYGRWDDIFFDNEKCFDLISKQLKLDAESKTPSLLAKWLPTINASSKTTRAKAKFISSKLGISDIAYRKLVRGIRKNIKAVEETMSARKWSEINYSAVPSQASRIYKNAFKKHDEARYDSFIEKAEKGEVKINASTLYPYQIYNSVQSDYSATLEALWKQLPDYTRGKNALVVADVSGSMSGDPMSVSVSLALYFAERNKGLFNNHFITFSGTPRLQRIVGKNLRDKMSSIEKAEWQQNTDVVAVFKLILSTAIKNKLLADEMPETIYIVSDMQFDNCAEYHTPYEVIKDAYANNGYKVPNIVFWNVNASGDNLPVQKDEIGVVLVSGFSPVVFKIAVENKTPLQIMLDTINSERYAKIKID
jgi:hypothetical protein